MLNVTPMLITLLELLLDKFQLLTVSLSQLYRDMYSGTSKLVILHKENTLKSLFCFHVISAFRTWLEFEFPVIMKPEILRLNVHAM